MEQTSPLQAQQLLGDHLFLLTLATGLLFVPVSALNAWHQPLELSKPRADSVPFPLKVTSVHLPLHIQLLQPQRASLAFQVRSECPTLPGLCPKGVMKDLWAASSCSSWGMHGQGTKVFLDGGEATESTGLGIVLSHCLGGNCQRTILWELTELGSSVVLFVGMDQCRACSLGGPSSS